MEKNVPNHQPKQLFDLEKHDIYRPNGDHPIRRVLTTYQYYRIGGNSPSTKPG